jgi:hypothetical protein
VQRKTHELEGLARSLETSAKRLKSTYIPGVGEVGLMMVPAPGIQDSIEEDNKALRDLTAAVDEMKARTPPVPYLLSWV